MVARADSEGSARRIFVAVLPDDATRAELVRRQALLLPRLAKARPTAPDNLHLTLAFLGMLEEGQVVSALEAMREAAEASCVPALDLPLAGLGSFGRDGRAILWQGLAPGPNLDALFDLQARLERALRGRGLSLEERPYRPHITLARGVRLGEKSAPSSLEGLLASEGARPAAPTPEHEGGTPLEGTPRLRADALSLMWSHHPEGGRLTYTELERVALRQSRP